VLTIIDILQVLVQIVRWIILTQFILSILIVFNVINTQNDFVRSLTNGVDRLTEPLYRPIRRFLPPQGGIDFAPLVVLVILIVISIILNHVAANIAFGAPL
jgi:YggT family protein